MPASVPTIPAKIISSIISVPLTAARRRPIPRISAGPMAASRGYPWRYAPDAFQT
jgi:hypothetical protein